jgi:hypothetical protein
MKPLIARTTTIVLFSLLILSCIDKGVESPVYQSNERPGQITLAFGSPPSEVTQVIARISREGYTTRVLELNVSDSSASGGFTDVATGVWHLRVEARDNAGTVRYSGNADVEVRPGQTAHVTLNLTPTSGGGIDIIVTWGTPPVPTNGLMAYYPLGPNANDVSGNGNHGSVFGASLTRDRYMNLGATWFDGIDDMISIPSSPTLHPLNQLTITFWVRVDSVTGMYCPIIHKGGNATPSLNNREYAVYIMGPHPGYHFEVYTGLYWSGSNTYQVGQWLFVAGVLNKVTHKIKTYVNGNFEREVDDPNATFFSNDYSILLGMERETTWPDHAPFRGALDELRLYNRALTVSEIQALYNQ